MQFSVAFLATSMFSATLAAVIPADAAAIAGLDPIASGYAKAVMAEVKREGLPKQACLSAISTALQESELHMYANNIVPASLSIKHDRIGSDLDSVGKNS